MLLRRAAPDSVVSVDWDTITFKLRGKHNWPSYRVFDMTSPLGYTQAEAQHIFESTDDFALLLDALESDSTERKLTADAFAAV
jgi:hypothetical protein